MAHGIKNKTDLECVYTMTLYITFIENYKGSIDNVILDILNKCLDYLQQKRTKLLNSGVFQVVILTFLLFHTSINNPCLRLECASGITQVWS